MFKLKGNKLRASVYYNDTYYFLLTFSGHSIYIMDLKKAIRFYLMILLMTN